MASTVLPNGTIIPEKFSRDWYADLYHNWQELDNLLGGGTPKDGTLTIQKNGTTVGTFSANQATNGTVNITVPTKTSDLTNDSGFITGVSWNDVADKPSFATVATSGSYNDLSNKPTIPSKTSDLTNDSGFITSDDTKIPLAGSNAISGSLIPATDNSIDVGSSTKNIKMLYTKGITIDGTQFSPSDYIPRSGGAVITGYLAKVNDTSVFSLWGAPTNNGGALINLYGKNQGTGLQGAYLLQAYDDTNGEFRYFIGYPNGTLTWFGQPIQYTSDARLKQQISQIDDKLLDAWEDVELSQFKYNDAVDQKGNTARLHTGYVVQQIDEACKSHNVDVSQYGLYCHEEYPQETEEVEVEQADGTKVKETKVIREASEHYSLRYTETLVVECAYLRKKNKDLQEQLNALSERLEKLENR